jgi:acyl carrier protein
MNTDTAPSTLDAVRSVVAATLGIDDPRADAMHAGTELLGSLPELDSMAVVELIYALEERFAIEVDGDEVTADVFETLGSLAAFVETQIG